MCLFHYVSLRGVQTIFYFTWNLRAGLHAGLGCYSLKINIFHFWGCRMNYYWDEHCGEIEGLVWGITHLKTFTRTFTSFPLELTQWTWISVFHTTVRAHIIHFVLKTMSHSNRRTRCTRVDTTTNNFEFIRSLTMLICFLGLVLWVRATTCSKVLMLGQLGKAALFNEHVQRMPTM